LLPSNVYPNILLSANIKWATRFGELRGRLKIRDLIKLIEADAWRLIRTRGSHRQYKHAIKKGRVTIPGHPGDDVQTGTLKSVLKQAGLRDRP
jgi:predicted RNA binding protein YcfA (HicA-like mRNA interferase family)